MTPILSVQALSKTFTLHLVGGRTITPLSDIAFDVAPGESIAVIGRTGSGKSTLLKSICGVYPPSHGTIVFQSYHGAIDIGSADDVEIAELRREEIGYVAQQLQVIPRISALDIASEPLLNCGTSADEARCVAQARLLEMSLPEHLHSVFPSTFSPGERQRLNIARATAIRPRMLLLDEPTAALDPLTKEVVVHALQAMNREGVTIIGIFHDLDLVERLAQRVIHLDGGRIVQTGTPSEVLPRFIEIG